MEHEARKVNAEALVELLKTEGLDFHSSSRSWVLDCPLCGKRKWAIRKTDGYSKCYKCDHDFKGFADYTLSVALKREKSALSKLFYGFVIATHVTEERGEERWTDHWEELSNHDVEVIDVATWPPEVLPHPDHRELDSPAGARGLAYLESRGIPLELAKEYGVKYNPVEERVIFPIVVEGILRGWQGRLVKSGQYTDSKERVRELPKALSEGECGGKVFMFQERLENAKHAVLVEGPVDAIKCHLLGGNVASMGKDNITSALLDIVVRRHGIKKVYLGLDDDAIVAIERTARELSWYGDIDIFHLRAAPGREDLGAGTLEENLEQFRTAKPLGYGQMFTNFTSVRYW